MTATSVLAGLNEEATQLELLSEVVQLLSATIARMPRTDSAKRVVVNTLDQGSAPLPTGATTAEMQLEMLSEMSQILSAILDRLPRTDAAHRAVVNTSDQGAVATTISSGTLTTASDVTRVNTLGIGTTARPTDGIPVHMSRIGSLHLLNQVIMS